MKTEFLTKCYPNLETALIQEIEEYAILKTFDANQFVVEQGQYIKYLPIIQSGCIKVFCNEDAISFLLYYIKSGESCIYSFAHVNNNEQANFSAVAEMDSELLLLPIDKVELWIKKYPSLNSIVLNNYKKHYNDLLDTTKQIICHDLEERLIAYLETKSKLLETDLISISHQEIADDLGTSREVISRIMKKTSLKKVVKQEGRKIKIL